MRNAHITRGVKTTLRGTTQVQRPKPPFILLYGARRILISDTFLKIENAKLRDRNSKTPPFFPKYDGLPSERLATDSHHPSALSKPKKAPTPPKEAKNLNTKTILPQTAEFVNTAHENILYIKENCDFRKLPK